jgi:hypothetical protein
MYSSDEKTVMILINGECNKNAFAVARLCRRYLYIFPKTLCFFTISFNLVNDLYIKIYETAQLTMFYVNFGNVLWVAFSIPSGSLSLVKYPV